METKNYSFYILKSDIEPDKIRYVGVTSNSISRRFTQHKYCAMHPEKRGLPVHKWMYSVYQNGGKINIEKIFECAESKWEETEKSLIKQYRDLGHNLLNIDSGGKGVITKEKRSIDSITRSVEAHKKPVTAYNLDGTKYRDFDSLTDAAQFLNGKINNIHSVLSGNSKSAYGYMWKYKSNEESNEKSIDQYQKKQIGIHIYQFDFNGNLLKQFESKKDVINFFNVTNYKALDRAIDNKTAYKESFWSTSPEIDITIFKSPFKYKIINGDNIIKVIEQKDIAKIIGSCKATVCSKLKNNTNFEYNGYIVEVI